MHGRQVVVKIQMNQSVDDPWFERKFNEEVRALSMIDHPGVIVAIDSGRTPDGKPFLVMQYVDGVTLRAVMSPEGMPLDRVASILQQVGHALGAAHEKGVWHRDLKPENLMLQSLAGTGERVRLIDFGIATVADLRNQYQNTTRVAGSYLYMAPEQALGQASAATDIYAMGLIAYEMVTGRKPFVVDNAIQLATLQRQGVRVKPSDLRPSLPAAAEQLILQSLEFDPLKRPRGARDFGDRLSASLLDSEATRMTVRAVQASGGRRKAWLAGAVLALAAVFASIWFVNRQQHHTQMVAVLRESEVKPPPAVHDAAAEQEIELAYWNSVKDSAEPQLYRAYLSKYPQGRFSSLAEAKIAILSRKAPPRTESAKAPNQAHEDEVEMAFWNSVKDGTEPQLYQDYLDKYPHGRFESLARTKLELFSKRHPPGSGRGSRLDSGTGLVPDLHNLPGIDARMAAELADWSALKDVKNPQAFRDFLKKYPNGLFAAVAKLKADGYGRSDGPPDFDEEHERHSLPPPRPALDVDSYSGPHQGELHWTGLLSKHGVLSIQGGKSSSGTLTSDLPRVPLTIQVVTTGLAVLEPPVPPNHWDRLVLRNVSGSPVTEIVIHWHVNK